jgi:hypothetical protein
MRITVEAMTLCEVFQATEGSGLAWRRYDEPGLLPHTPAVYLWAGSATAVPLQPAISDSDPAVDPGKAADDVILYIGKTARGLYERYHALWPSDYLDSPEAHGHARIINRHRGRLYAAEASVCPDQPCRPKCDGSDGAATWERRLIALHLQRTGLVPVINGGAWFNVKPHYEMARQWAARTPRQQCQGASADPEPSHAD